jgi:hypothetical protein
MESQERSKIRWLCLSIHQLIVFYELVLIYIRIYRENGGKRERKIGCEEGAGEK